MFSVELSYGVENGVFCKTLTFPDYETAKQKAESIAMALNMYHCEYGDICFWANERYELAIIQDGKIIPYIVVPYAWRSAWEFIEIEA